MGTPQKKILVVEDDRAISSTLAEILESEGYAVQLAGHGQEALETLKTSPLPQLILLDLMMPVMDGFEFREHQVKNPEWNKIPVVIMSADGRVQDKIKKTAGVAYMKKPPDIDALIQIIAEHCS